MIVLIDNYDSFTWNLYHFLGDLGCKTEVYRNDKISVTDVIKLKPSQIVISPGPCDPNSAGISMSLVNAAIKNDIPLLGVCLGHQSIAQALGGEVIRCHEIIHGKTDNIINDQKTIFRGIPDKFNATRYHSLVVSNKNLPSNIEISAKEFITFCDPMNQRSSNPRSLLLFVKSYSGFIGLGQLTLFQ